MPTFGDRSLTNLAECHHDLQTVCHEAIAIMDFSVIKGHRPEAEQNEAFANGTSHITWPNGKHNSQPSMAVDLLPYQPWRENRSDVWNDTKAFTMLAGIMFGIANGLYRASKINHLLIWGGDWNRDFNFQNQKFFDLPHFELYKP